MTAARRPMDDTFPDDEARWAAAQARDPAAIGAFLVCVRTTGVYCLPTCPGRPLRKNVFFVAARIAAERAGFRACKRCRPDRAAEAPAKTARRRASVTGGRSPAR